MSAKPAAHACWPRVGTDSCGPWTDLTTAAANHKAHITLFNDAFPEFEASQQPVSLVGESHAGVYVPLFVDAWLDDPIRGPSGKLINFKGFAIGASPPLPGHTNACVACACYRRPPPKVLMRRLDLSLGSSTIGPRNDPRRAASILCHSPVVDTSTGLRASPVCPV